MTRHALCLIETGNRGQSQLMKLFLSVLSHLLEDWHNGKMLDLDVKGNGFDS